MTAAEHYLGQFARLKAALPGRRLPWLARRREAALAAFAGGGLPTLRDEDWKYTSVARIEKGGFGLLPLAETAANTVSAGEIEALTLPGTQRLVFVDGRYAPTLSSPEQLPAGVTVASLAAVLERDPERLRQWLDGPRRDPPAGFAALNAACMADGAYIHLAAGAVMETPIHLLFVARKTNLATHSRNLVVAEPGSRACIVEHHAALGVTGYFTNVITDIVVGQDAEIKHYKLQEESTTAFHIAAVNADLAQGSRFASSSFALGGALARVDITVGLNAEAAECVLDGLYMADGHQHLDHHTRIDHAGPRGTSRELYKGVLSGAARAVFNGKVIVHAGAQQSDASQTNRNLLLSDDAEIDTKPQLEIWADDVKCSHGATVGQLDAEQIFYLRSRGIDDGAARAMLTYAFAAEMVERVALVPLRARLDGLLRERLSQVALP